MTNTHGADRTDRLTRTLRILGWTLIGGLLITPAVAMQLTEEVQWTTSDFIFAAVVLIGAGGIAELALRASRDWSYRIAAGLAVLGSVLLFWINGAVGIIGSEDHPANLLYLAVIAAVFVGAVASRFRAGGLSITLVCAAALQALIGSLAVIRGWGAGSEAWPRPVIVLTVVFALVWLGAAALFRKAASMRTAV